MLVTPSMPDTDVKSEHLLKAYLWMVVTDSGMVIRVNLLHPKKASFPMVMTPSMPSTDVNLVHPEKAASWMSVTDSGMVIAVNAAHP